MNIRFAICRWKRLVRSVTARTTMLSAILVWVRVRAAIRVVCGLSLNGRILSVLLSGVLLWLKRRFGVPSVAVPFTFAVLRLFVNRLIFVIRWSR